MGNTCTHKLFYTILYTIHSALSHALDTALSHAHRAWLAPIHTPCSKRTIHTPSEEAPSSDPLISQSWSALDAPLLHALDAQWVFFFLFSPRSTHENSLIRSFLWPITLISPIHPLITSFLTPTHTAPIHTLHFSQTTHTAPTHTAIIPLFSFFIIIIIIIIYTFFRNLWL